MIALVFVAGAIAFGAAVRGPFQFDDVAAIPGNPTIERVSTALTPPPRTAVSGRPVVNVTLAANYAVNRALGIDQTDRSLHSRAAAGYRAANIVLHCLAALLLFGIIRRTVRFGGVPEEWVPFGEPLAVIVATIWLVHPLQTEAVDYVIQRTELLVSAFYLATLYASIRAWDATKPRARAAWYVAAVVACLLGMGSKEVMASTPIAVMLYDRAFRMPTWKSLVTSPRRWFYLALLATLIPLGASVVGGARSDSVGFGHGITWYQYLYSQGWAIARYVKLALWPDELTFDYGEHLLRGGLAIVGLTGLAAFAAATLWAWRRATWLAFLGTWFFMVLGPSSSVVPITTEIAAERRVYLALAPLLVLVVVGVEALRRRIAALDAHRRDRALWITAALVGLLYFASSAWSGHVIAPLIAGPGNGRWAVALLARLLIGAGVAALAYVLVGTRNVRRVLAVVVAVLLLTSASRSALYADPEALWRDAAEKMPQNPRAYDNLAAAILQKDSTRDREAERELRQAITVDSMYVTAWTNLADVLLKRGNIEEGRALLEHALRINPQYVNATERLGELLVKLGETDQAITYLERVVATQPTEEALGTLAIAYTAKGRRDEAKVMLRRMLAINPRRIDALTYLGAMLTEDGHPDEAVGYIESAVQAGGGTPAAYALLSVTYAELGRRDESVRAASTAAGQPGADAGVYLQLGRAMMVAQLPQEAERFLSRAVELAPTNPEALTRLGMTKGATGHPSEAVALFRRALSAAPGYEPAQRALAAAGSPAR